MLVRDLMRKEFHSVGPDTPIREAVVKMRAGQGLGEGGLPSLLVTEKGRLLGILTLSDILRAILPNYMKDDPHLARLGWNGLLEMQCRRVQDKPVRDIMTSEVIQIREDAVLTEAADQLLLHHIHSLPVVRGNAVVGILYISDLARETFAKVVEPNR